MQTIQTSPQPNTINHGVAQIHKVLLSIGVPTNLLGYTYILHALQLIIINPEYMHAITKELYVDIAKEYNSTPSRVERSIRHAIGVAFLYGNLNHINKIFKNCIRADKNVPANSLFLSRLYYHISCMED